jgi:tetratricopeptide (TPR) repeat protein
MTTIQARRAERRFELVRGLAKGMLYELHDEMERLPGSTALRASTIRTVVRHLDRLAEDGSRDDSLDLEIAQAYQRAGGLEGHPFLSNVGDSTAALNSYRKAIAIFERLAKRPTMRNEAIRGLIDTHLNARDVAALLGNPAAAASHLHMATSIATAAFASGGSPLPRDTQANVYFRLSDAEYQRGAANGELEFSLKALQVCQDWVAAAPGLAATRNLRDAYHKVGTARARNGDLHGAQEALLRAERISDELLRQNGATPEYAYNSIALQNSFGDVFGATDDPNFDDRAGALSHYRKAFAMAEALATADPQNRNARRNLASCYRRLGMMHVDSEPAAGLDYYQKALSISEDLNVGGLNLEYLYAVSRAHMGVGEALHNLRRYDDAVRNLQRGVELQSVIADRSPDRIWNLRVLSRTYALLGSALLAQGDTDRALEAFEDGLAAADRMLRRAPSSLYHQLDRADVLEAMGRAYVLMAERPRLSAERRRILREEARSFFAQSLAIWQNWTSRRVGLPYATRRAARAGNMIASIRTP